MIMELYRHFGAAGELLYVGVSRCSALRLNGHHCSPWFKRITTITIQRFKSRASAFTAERKAIQKEQPEFNRVRKKKDKRFRAITKPISLYPEQLAFALERCRELCISLSRYVQKLIDYDRQNNVMAKVLALEAKEAAK